MSVTEELKEVHCDLVNIRRELSGEAGRPMTDVVFLYGYLQGRGFELTRGMEEHPDWWDYGCQCDSCLSYAEADDE